MQRVRGRTPKLPRMMRPRTPAVAARSGRDTSSRAQSGLAVHSERPAAAYSPPRASSSQGSEPEAQCVGGAYRDFLRRRGKIKHPLRWICMARCIADPDTIMGELQSLGLVSDLCVHWWEVAEVDARRVEEMLLGRAQ